MNGLSAPAFTAHPSVSPGHAETRDHDPAGHGAVICGVTAYSDAGEAHSWSRPLRAAILSLGSYQTCGNKPTCEQGAKVTEKRGVILSPPWQKRIQRSLNEARPGHPRAGVPCPRPPTVLPTPQAALGLCLDRETPLVYSSPFYSWTRKIFDKWNEMLICMTGPIPGAGNTGMKRDRPLPQ